MKIIISLMLLNLISCSSTKTVDYTKNLRKDLWVKNSKLKGPESSYYHAPTGLVFVSNVAGAPLKKEKLGFISIYSRKGELLRERWIDGLYAPKGLMAHGNYLYVSDVRQVVKVDINTGTIVQKLPIKDVGFLNDIAISKEGVVYISDMFKNRIYQIKDQKIMTLIESESLSSPNGLHVIGNDLFVAAWGAGISQEDFSTKRPGQLLKLNLDTKEVTEVSGNLGNLDGIAVTKNGHFILSDWIGGKVYSFNPKDKSTELIYEGAKGTADLSIDKKRGLIYIPHMTENKLSVIKL